MRIGFIYLGFGSYESPHAEVKQDWTAPPPVAHYDTPLDACARTTCIAANISTAEVMAIVFIETRLKHQMHLIWLICV